MRCTISPQIKKPSVAGFRQPSSRIRKYLFKWSRHNDSLVVGIISAFSHNCHQMGVKSHISKFSYNCNYLNMTFATEYSVTLIVSKSILILLWLTIVTFNRLYLMLEIACVTSFLSFLRIFSLVSLTLIDRSCQARRGQARVYASTRSQNEKWFLVAPFQKWCLHLTKDLVKYTHRFHFFFVFYHLL